MEECEKETAVMLDVKLKLYVFPMGLYLSNT